MRFLKTQVLRITRCLLLLFWSVTLSAGASSQDEPVTALKYSLYLPKNYSAEKKYPLLIFLDPSASGNIPVNNYTVAADELDVIMVGSLDSKNFDITGTTESVNTIHSDVIAKYAIDTQRVWIAGFSGGARASCSVAIANTYIKGIITCGAGFAGENKITAERAIPFVSIAGNVDMNYEELFEISDYLESIHNPAAMLVFDGGHQWPPNEYMEMAITWLSDQNPGGRKNTALPNPANYINALNRKRDSGLLYQAYFEAGQLKKIPGFASLASPILSAIEKEIQFPLDELRYMNILAQERNYMDRFSTSFNAALQIDELAETQPGEWKAELKIIRDMLKSKERYQQLSGIRCLDYATRCCIEYALELMTEAQYRKAYNVAGILHFFSPEDNLPYYLMAKAAAGLKDKPLSEKNMITYSKNGKIRKDLFLTDPLFIQLFTKEEMEQLLTGKGD